MTTTLMIGSSRRDRPEPLKGVSAVMVDSIIIVVKKSDLSKSPSMEKVAATYYTPIQDISKLHYAFSTSNIPNTKGKLANVMNHNTKGSLPD